jgi:hypothetical protein
MSFSPFLSTINILVDERRKRNVVCCYQKGHGASMGEAVGVRIAENRKCSVDRKARDYIVNFGAKIHGPTSAVL